LQTPRRAHRRLLHRRGSRPTGRSDSIVTSQRDSAPSSTGRYELKNLPPVSSVAALTDVEPGDWWNQSAERILPVASKITLSEGEAKTLDLKIGGAPER
jgi:hypothetical protein